MVGSPTHLKNMRKSKWVHSPIFGVKIKNVWNHHLVVDVLKHIQFTGPRKIIPWSCFLQRMVKCPKGAFSFTPHFCWANVSLGVFVLPASFQVFGQQVSCFNGQPMLRNYVNVINGRETTWITWNHLNPVTTCKDQKGTHFPKGGEGRKWAVRHQKTLRNWFYGYFIARHFDHETVNLQRIEIYESLHLTFKQARSSFCWQLSSFIQKKIGGTWPHAIWHWSYTRTSEIIHVSYAMLPYITVLYPGKRCTSKFEKILPRHFFARLPQQFHMSQGLNSLYWGWEKSNL